VIELSSTNLQNVVYSARLETVQRRPLPLESFSKPLYASDNYFNTSGFAWSRIQSQYNVAPVSTIVVPTSFDNSLGLGDGIFKVVGTIDLSQPQQLYYTPGIAFVLKQGWIQYFSILALVSALLYPLYYIVVVNGLVSTFTSIDGGAVSGKKMKTY
jgi:hypothetical protein